jgi:hypothetical protein
MSPVQIISIIAPQVVTISLDSSLTRISFHLSTLAERGEKEITILRELGLSNLGLFPGELPISIEIPEAWKTYQVKEILNLTEMYPDFFTVDLKLKDKTGNNITIKAVVDSAVTANFISQEIAEGL